MRSLIRDGVRLAFDDRGSGDPPLLLVHGWCCDHTFLAPQAEHFATKHRCVSVDLRGHGLSDKPEQQYAPDVFADDLAWLCDELGLDRPVAIGHSLGGVIVLDLAARYPDVTRAIVLIDSPVIAFPRMLAAGHDATAGPRPLPESDARTGLLDALHSPDFREAQRCFIEVSLFRPSDDPARRATIVELMNAAPQHVMVGCFDGLVSWDGAAAAASCQVPFLDIAASDATTDVAELRAACPHMWHGVTVGTGHFNQLEVPDQVNAMIDRFLRSLPQRD
jgi:pimeloyl-ACP methyl ester carboxylesterase